MAIPFPSSPTDGQEFQYFGLIYYWSASLNTWRMLFEGDESSLDDDSVETADIQDEAVTFAKLAGAAIVTEAEGISANDTDVTIPTSAAVKDYTDTAIANLVDSSPAALDTLNELAAAIGDDANYATTVTTALSLKADKATTVSAGDGLTGGGDLSTNRTLTVDVAASGDITAQTANKILDATIVIDEDSFATNSATRLPSQQSVKAYADTGLALKADKTTTITAGDGMVGGGSLASNRTLSVDIAAGGDIAAQTATKILDASAVIDEDNMATNSATRLPTQQSVKAYTDTLRSDLASTSNALGASLVGIEDAGGLITATTVEAALAENRTAIDAIEADYLTSGDIGSTVQAWDAQLDSLSSASANGVSLVTAASYAAMRGLLDLEAGTDFYAVSASLRVVATRTALKALATSSETKAYLTEAGREDFFLFLAGDYSTEVTADAGEGVYIAADDTASSSGAWVRVYEGNPNVTWWGATGDGTTDDATAINRALIGATGKTLYFPPATYKVGSALSVPADTFIVAHGATLNASTAGNITVLTFANGGGVEGAHFVGPGNGTYNASSIAIACSGTNNSPSAPTYVDGPVIRHCHIEEFAGSGTRFQYCNQPIVEHCRFDDIGSAANAGMSCNDGVFDHNVVDDVSPGTGGGDAYGCFWDRNEAGDETADPRSYRCSMSYNTILNSAGEALDSHAGVDIKIVGNTVRSCLKGIVLTRSTISSSPALAPQNCVVANNTIVIEDDGPAIVVSGAFDSGWVEYATGCVVSDNTVYGGGDAADNEGGSVLLQGTKRLAFTGNTITAPTVWGINVYFGNIGFNISGNVITDPWDNTVTTPACICIRSTDNSGYIGGNTFRYEDSGLGTYVAVNSILIYGSLTGLSLTIDRCAFDGIASGRLSYTANTTTGVNASNLAVESGTASISLTNTSSVSHAVTFAGRFPSVPTNIQLTRSGTPVPGTVAKSPILETSTTTVTGTTIVVRPYDLSTFGGAGTLTVRWVAST